MSSTIFYRFMLLFFSIYTFPVCADWNFWWTYDGISGPEFWGILNPDWFLCNKGHRQSPIDIKPGMLLYDPNLKSIFVNKNRMNGILENNGHTVAFYSSVNTSVATSESLTSSTTVMISGGPLSYAYTFHSLHIHFGQIDSYGSEHSISGFLFPGEIQLIGYNSDLYENYEEAMSRPNGLVGIAIFLKIKYRSQKVTIKSLSLRELIPDDQSYITYEGSLTMPSCDETVTWIVINKALFITKEQLHSLRNLMQGNQEIPKAPLGNNFRPSQLNNDRVVRTSIDFKNQDKSLNCPTMRPNIHYEINQKLWNNNI